MVAHALNRTTAEFIGGPSISIADLRPLKAQQLEEALADEGDAEPGAIGASFSDASAGASPNALWFWVSAVGLVLVGGSGYALGRTRKSGAPESD